MTSKPPTLLLLGSGPGIGVNSVALLSKYFPSIALVSRSASRLEADKQTILSSSKRDLDIRTWAVDLASTSDFKAVLDEIAEWGRVTTVLFNAAAVVETKFFEVEEDVIRKHFEVTTIALYATAKKFFPILLETPAEDKPSFLVTSSLLWQEPVAELFSLSLVKAAQRSLVQSLRIQFPSIHISLLNVGGYVIENDQYLSPEIVAQRYLELYEQEKEEWTVDETIWGGPNYGPEPPRH